MYIRTMFTQTLAKPPQLPEATSFDMTPLEKQQVIPPTTSYDAGRQQFLVMCSHCHGLAGDGKGYAGEYLNPKPANLQDKLGPNQPGINDSFDGKTFAKVTNGINNTAMPIWGEFLAINMRWKDVKFLKDSFNKGLGPDANKSHQGDGAVPLPYVRADTGIFQSEIATIVPSAGKPVYEKYCATCHGDKGEGKGPGTKGLVGGGPAAFPKNINETYVFSTVRSGLPHTMMYGFMPLLTETEIWNVTEYTVELTGGKFGG
jgi:mono/diheme cytochrome c family protein